MNIIQSSIRSCQERLVPLFKDIFSAPENSNKRSYINSYSDEKGMSKSALFMDKGESLEYKIFKTLNSIYGTGTKKILVDLLIDKNNGHSTQIDLIFIHKTGIYVIESKNFSCTVSGNNTNNNWLKKYSNKEIHTFYNPIKQNNTHIHEIKRVLNINHSDYFTSLIVFSDNTIISHFNNTNDFNFNTKILNYNKLKTTLREMIKIKNTLLSDDEIFNIYNELSKYSRQSFEAKSQHIKYVKSLQDKQSKS